MKKTNDAITANFKLQTSLLLSFRKSSIPEDLDDFEPFEDFEAFEDFEVLEPLDTFEDFESFEDFKVLEPLDDFDAFEDFEAFDPYDSDNLDILDEEEREEDSDFPNDDRDR